MKPVLIVGGGPVGLTAALCLASADVAVILFEANAAIPEDLRASTFHPPTLDMLDRFGLGTELVAQGLVTPRWQIRLQETGERAEFDLGVLAGETAHPYRLQCEQQKLQRLLLARLAACPHADIRFGQPVDAVGQDAAGVWLESDGRRTMGSWLIGADGSHSIVRRSCAIGFEGETYPETIILVTTDFDFDRALEGLSGVNYVWSSTGTFSLLHLPEVWRCTFYPLPGQTLEEAMADDAIEQHLQNAAPIPERHRVLHKRSYRIHQRVADTYRAGRMLLAGDAAHLNSPSGGMGMNGGIHDAFNLTEKLVRALAGADEGLLDVYVRQRRTVAVEHVIAQADRNRRRMRETDPERRRALLKDLQRTASDPELARAYLRNSAMITGLEQAAAID
ncbi:MAG TPA: NAD(P)/FAD-dependent oxidoreductase [Steroidobacteraceae bacterium]|nr:NAD(P)/FAD-dependent oxidoreductase [Steroidobacteraceae bacterium]